MPLFDLQRVGMSNGLQLIPKMSINIRHAHRKEKATSADSGASTSRKTSKMSQIKHSTIHCNRVHDVPKSSHRFTIPKSRLKTKEMTPKQMDEIVEYEQDEEDYFFLEEVNEKRKQKKKGQITEESFELTIDRLEKESCFKDDGPHEIQSTNDDDCCICANGDIEDTNQIIYCDMCNIAVHQDCYGVGSIPEGEWLCRKCTLSSMKPIKCELCPLRNGAFKPTTEGKWAHVACALWHDEVFFGDEVLFEPIEGVQESLKTREKPKCLVCGVKTGLCLQCSKDSCTKSFHVTCAREAKLQMVTDYVEVPETPNVWNVTRFVYCNAHGSVKLGEKEFEENKKRAIDAIRRSGRREQTDAAPVTRYHLPTLDAEAKKRIVERVGDKSVVEDIVPFWFYKRKKRCGLPLIRRLQAKKKVVQVTNPRVEMATKGRYMYEKTRLLADLVEKREKHYLERIRAKRQMMKFLLTPLEDHLVKFIQSISHMDNMKFFRDDPLKQLFDYKTIVKKPMYLSLMKKNAEGGVYKTEGEMKEHLDLIFKNCQLYNKTNDQVLKYAKEKQRMMNQAYSDLVEHLNFTRKWMDKLNLEGETEESAEEVKEGRRKEVKKKEGKEEERRKEERKSQMKKKEVKEEERRKEEKKREMMKKEVKEEERRKEEKKREMMKKEVKEEPSELRNARTPRVESNGQKRKAEEPKMEDITETPSIKRDKRDNEMRIIPPSPRSVFGRPVLTTMSGSRRPSSF